MVLETSSGALLANDCLVHYTISDLPFGGVGMHSRLCTIWHKQSFYRKATHIIFNFLWKSPNPTGNSGTGCYHGKYTFDQLSHLRSCLIKNLNMERVNLIRYPPHTMEKLRWARILLTKQVNLKCWRNLAHIAMLAALAAFVVQVLFTSLPYSLLLSL